MALERGDVLVLYTDGVLDTVGEGDRFGEQRLREALGRPTGRWRSAWPRCTPS